MVDEVPRQAQRIQSATHRAIAAMVLVAIVQLYAALNSQP